VAAEVTKVGPEFRSLCQTARDLGLPPSTLVDLGKRYPVFRAAAPFKGVDRRSRLVRYHRRQVEICSAVLAGAATIEEGTAAWEAFRDGLAVGIGAGVDGGPKV